MKKVCKKHGLYEHSKETNGYYRCKRCRNDHVITFRQKIKQRIVDAFGGKCRACEYDSCIDNMVFHHIRPNDKDFSIGNSGSTLSWEKVKKEAEKCDLLCCRCHGEVHSANIILKVVGDKHRIFQLYEKINSISDKTAIAYAVFNFTDKWGYTPHEETLSSNEIWVSSLRKEGWDKRVVNILNEFSDLSFKSELMDEW